MIYEAMGTGAKGSNLAYWQAFEYMFVLVKGDIKTVNRIADVKNKTIGLYRGGRWRDDGLKEKFHATKEIGVRKVLGAEKASLIRQFLWEAILLALISFVISIVFTMLLMPLLPSLDACPVMCAYDDGLGSLSFA